jgi:hypothetical protein
MSDLIEDQEELDDYLKRLVERGRPLRGLLVIEYAAEAEPNGVWRKTGTFRIGKHHAVHNQILSDNWVIKEYSFTSESLQHEEQAAIVANDLAESVRRALDLAGVEWGRADHATFLGRQVIFEVNTNPRVRSTDGHGHPIRSETKRISFSRICRLLDELDWGDGSVIRYRGKPVWRRLKESQRIRRLFMRTYHDRSSRSFPCGW